MLVSPQHISWQFHPQIEQKKCLANLPPVSWWKQTNINLVQFHVKPTWPLNLWRVQKKNIHFLLILRCSLLSSSTHLTNKHVLVKFILVVVLQKENIHPCFSSLANLAQKADKLNSSQINYPPNTHTHTQSGIPSQRWWWKCPLWPVSSNPKLRFLPKRHKSMPVCVLKLRTKMMFNVIS